MKTIKDVIKNLNEKLTTAIEGLDWHNKRTKEFETEILGLKETIATLESIKKEKE